MQRATTSSERTPLVQPTYMFESSITRQYQKRLRNFQCVICVALLASLAIALLVTVGYHLNEDFDNQNDTSVPEIPQTVSPNTQEPSTGSNLTLLTLSAGSAKIGKKRPFPPDSLNITDTAPEMQPILNQTWPLNGRPLTPWAGNTPTPDAIIKAVKKGKDALKKRSDIESKRAPLPGDLPASRAQRAAATSPEVKPMADNAYAAEEATRALVNRSSTDTDVPTSTIPPDREGGVGLGPPTADFFPEPRYCLKEAPPCPKSKYRTVDGTCNNLANPLRWGVANTPFRRTLPADYGDGISSPRSGINGAPLPSARDVSVTVHRPSYAHDSQFTVMLAVWGQFVDHDITATALSKGANSSSLSCCDASLPPHPECFPVRLDVEDPFYEAYNLTCMEFVRSASAPTCHFGPREQLNQASAFIDGSTVYGFTKNRTQRLRTLSGGLLRMLRVGARDLLPPSTDPNDGCNTVEMNAQGRYCFETGDDRANENLHLTTMHLLWARQHNRIAAALARLNPHWGGETVYQEARRILGAQMQHITYKEFLPSILGADVMWALNLTLKDNNFSSAYDPTVDPSVANHFSASAFRFAHTLLPGLIHSADLATGTINYIQLHQMLFNPYALYQDKGARGAIKSAMDTPVHSVEPHVTSELSEHLFERPIAINDSSGYSAAKSPLPCGLDLVSLNIQRGRDHGLPAYPAWREHCGLPRPRNFSDLDNIFDELSLSRICKIYQNVDDIDLYTGALAEDPRGRLLGPTLTCLVADQFLRLKLGDRFWYETDDPEVGFTLEQLTEIRKTTLAGVICANEELLDQAQPRVMESVSATNPLVDCRELPQPSWTPWQEQPVGPANKPGKGGKGKGAKG